MSKIALLFAGQGAQMVGMGKSFAENFPAAKTLFDHANSVLGYDLASICFKGPEEDLTRTENAQPGIYLISWIALQLLLERMPTLKFEATAGLSLGEFTALAAADVISFEDGLTLVRQRGRFMQEACAATDGTMAAILGLDEDATRQVAEAAGVQVANLNCPGQIVLSGETSKVARACELAKERGAKRAMELSVAGAYHSNLMNVAQERLKIAMATVDFGEPALTVISNVTAQPHTTPEEIRERMLEQVVSPVRWEHSMRYLLSEGFDTFIELGPGTALSGFMKRIGKEARILNVNDPASLRTAVQALTV